MARSYGMDHRGVQAVPTGYARRNPVDPFSGPTFPGVASTPFDITLDLGGDLPSLEITGTLGRAADPGPTFFEMQRPYAGAITSVRTSAPWPVAGAPAILSDLIADPGAFRVRMEAWDWDLRELPLTLVYRPASGVSACPSRPRWCC